MKEILYSLAEQARDALLDNSGGMLLTALIIIMITGLVGGIIARFLKQPLILGYILSGVFVGAAYKAGFGPAANESLSSLADFGVALLLFSMGLEFSKNDIRPVYKVAVWGSLAQVLFTMIAACVLAFILSKYHTELFTGFASYMLFATAFVSTSTAVVLKTLTSRRRMGTLSSRVMIGISIVQDLSVMPVMLIISKLDDLSSGIAQALGPLILGAAFMYLMMTVGAKYIPLYLKQVAKLESKELFLLAVTGLALGIGAFSESVGVSFSFGAFLAGIVLSDSDYGKKALYEMMPVRDLFAMLFFVSIGMMLDLRYLLDHFQLVLMLVFLTGMTRTVFLSAVTWCSGYRNVIPVAMFFGMFPTSEIAFIVIQTGRAGGIFTDGLFSLILCIVVCSMIIGPAFDALTAPVYSLLKRMPFWHASYQDIELPLPDLNNHVIIAGGGAIARSIAKLLTRLQMPYVIIESDHPTFQAAKKDSLTCIYGDPQQDVILTKAGIGEAKILLLAADGINDNLEVIRHARHMNPKILIVARADSPAEVEQLHKARILEIVQPKFEAGLELTRQALLAMQVQPVEIQNYLDSVRFDRYKPLMEGSQDYSAIAKMRSFAGLVALNWVKLPANSPFTGRSFADSRIRSRCGVSVVGVLHDGKFISNPPPEHIPQAGDILALIGTAEQQSAFAHEVGIAAPAATPAAAEHTADHTAKA